MWVGGRAGWWAPWLASRAAGWWVPWPPERCMPGHSITYTSASGGNSAPTLAALTWMAAGREPSGTGHTRSTSQPRSLSQGGGERVGAGAGSRVSRWLQEATRAPAAGLLQGCCCACCVGSSVHCTAKHKPHPNRGLTRCAQPGGCHAPASAAANHPHNSHAPASAAANHPHNSPYTSTQPHLMRLARRVPRPSWKL